MGALPLACSRAKLCAMNTKTKTLEDLARKARRAHGR
jgi:hypothetical protein